MDPSLVSAASGLAGAAIGGAMSILGSWLVNVRQVRAEWLVRDLLRRQEIYKDFMEAASKCYVDALQHEKPDLSSLAVLYGILGRMRVISSPEVVAAADHVMREITETYFRPNVTLSREGIASLFQDERMDITRQISEACRAELESLRAQQFQPL